MPYVVCLFLDITRVFHSQEKELAAQLSVRKYSVGDLDREDRAHATVQRERFVVSFFFFFFSIRFFFNELRRDHTVGRCLLQRGKCCAKSLATCWARRYVKLWK